MKPPMALLAAYSHIGALRSVRPAYVTASPPPSWPACGGGGQEGAGPGWWARPARASLARAASLALCVRCAAAADCVQWLACTRRRSALPDGSRLALFSQGPPSAGTYRQRHASARRTRRTPSAACLPLPAAAAGHRPLRPLRSAMPVPGAGRCAPATFCCACCCAGWRWGGPGQITTLEEREMVDRPIASMGTNIATMGAATCRGMLRLEGAREACP
jgi:hypothetical protein